MATSRFTLPSKQDTLTHVLMPYYECWSCGQPANHHCGPGEPQPGDVILCLNCADPSIVGDDGLLQQPDPDNHAGIIADPEYRSLKSTIQAANRRAMRLENPGG